jgi:hypothetical protein
MNWTPFVWFAGAGYTHFDDDDTREEPGEFVAAFAWK